MVRAGPGSYKLRMNRSEIEAEIHTLRDGGLLMQASIILSLLPIFSISYASTMINFGANHQEPLS